MNEQIKKIKVLNTVKESAILNVENSIKEIKGVLDVKFDLENNVLTYVLDYWSSDYDVMVSILNVLSDVYQLEAEPYFEESEGELKGETESVAIENNEYSEESEEGEESEEDIYEELDENQVKKKELKYKFIEIGLSLICLIVGLILQSFSKTNAFAPYLFVASFSIVGYEFIFNTLASLFKKQFVFHDIALLLAVISSLILQTTLGSAIVMIAYATITTLYELFKLEITKKYEFNFDLTANAKINKINAVILSSVFGVCLVIAFILPIFLGNYSANLLECAKRANAILLVFAITPSIISVPLSYALVYKHALKNGVKINEETAYFNVANVKTVAFLGQKIFIDENGELKESALGSVLELYDASVLETVLLSSKTKESTSQLRKELSISASVSSLDDAGKNNEVIALKNSAKNSTVLAVGDLLTKANVTLALSDINDGFDIVIKDGNLKKVPFTVKLLKRFKSIIIQNVAFTLALKVVISALCGFGLIANLAVAVAPILVLSVLSILNALRNTLEII